MEKIILSGMRPTGPLHIGHLFGALKNWKRLQDEGYVCYYMIADYHALSTEYLNPKNIKNYVEEMAIDFLSSGLDPEKSTIFIQSLVPEHTELHLIFSMFVPIPYLERNPVYKEQVEEIKDRDLHTYGFLGYPVLQAADILIYKANYVPIGIDQMPHLELTREIARKFNYLYGETFPEPEAILTETPKIPGIDGRKMSKSYNNAIYLKDSPEIIKEKVSNMFTDPKRIYRKDPGHPETCPVFLYQKIFNVNRIEEIENDCKNAIIGCTDCKRELGEKLAVYLEDIRIKREKLEKDKKKLMEYLIEGSKKARNVAQKTIIEVKKKVGVFYEC
ncbi:MAG: tryptophan--tRNA ligase [Candidatus Omnitrophica bacterium]|nr:tryptophan--tRNA ligase [Candidatus Omnitrophota bacterium]MCM8806846.1 tryptophan--tRNA ligase [Candidatus Omnitrophota bacterium]